jgi:predicted alpha/beta-hydrolase family hydrolase
MAATRILLAPGASGTIERLRSHARGLERRGFEVELVTLPRGSAERAMPVYRSAIAGRDGIVTGGQSFGGRVASLLAAESAPAALVCFSFPLHAPGRQAAWEERTAHWPAIACPTLLLSGESDPFAQVSLLREAAGRLPDGRLVTYPGLGHTLGPVLEDALDEVAAFLTVHT